VRDRIKLILFANMKSHAGFLFLSKLVTLIDLERRNDRSAHKRPRAEPGFLSTFAFFKL